MGKKWREEAVEGVGSAGRFKETNGSGCAVRKCWAVEEMSGCARREEKKRNAVGREVVRLCLLL